MKAAVHTRANSRWKKACVALHAEFSVTVCRWREAPTLFLTFVMTRGSRCSVPPLTVKPQGALPCSSTSTSSSSSTSSSFCCCCRAPLHLILPPETLRSSLESTASMMPLVHGAPSASGHPGRRTRIILYYNLFHSKTETFVTFL